MCKLCTNCRDGKIYQTVYYNLDVIISVGYRMKSQRGTNKNSPKKRLRRGVPLLHSAFAFKN
jgi:hypothetical protein